MSSLKLWSAVCLEAIGHSSDGEHLPQVTNQDLGRRFTVDGDGDGPSREAVSDDQPGFPRVREEVGGHRLEDAGRLGVTQHRFFLL